jgi:hypothetical protein
MKQAAIAVFLGTATLSVYAQVQYSGGWAYREFFQEVLTCKSAIIYPAAEAYLAKGVASKQPAEGLRSEVISLLPLFEASASSACYCAVNEVAKTKPYSTYYGSGDFSMRMKTLHEVLNLPVCNDKMSDAMAKLESKEAREALRLK